MRPLPRTVLRGRVALEQTDVDVVQPGLLAKWNLAALQGDLRSPPRALEARVNALVDPHVRKLGAQPPSLLDALGRQLDIHPRIAVDAALEVQRRLGMPREDQERSARCYGVQSGTRRPPATGAAAGSHLRRRDRWGRG